MLVKLVTLLAVLTRVQGQNGFNFLNGNPANIGLQYANYYSGGLFNPQSNGGSFIDQFVPKIPYVDYIPQNNMQFFGNGNQNNNAIRPNSEQNTGNFMPGVNYGDRPYGNEPHGERPPFMRPHGGPHGGPHRGPHGGPHEGHRPQPPFVKPNRGQRPDNGYGSNEDTNSNFDRPPNNSGYNKRPPFERPGNYAPGDYDKNVDNTRPNINTYPQDTTASPNYVTDQVNVKPSTNSITSTTINAVEQTQTVQKETTTKKPDEDDKYEIDIRFKDDR